METDKFKICPECQKHNPPHLLECRFCEADLTGVRVVDSTFEQAASLSDQDAEAQTDGAMVRICECGAENAPQARKCKACGEDISDIMPVPAAQKNDDGVSFVFRSLDGTFCATLEKPVTVVGREAEWKEYLKDKVYVSRQHARFTIAAGKVYLVNLSQTNKTFLNDREIPDETSVCLAEGDEIGLGGKTVSGTRQDKAAYFIFQGQQ